ncbi:MAG: PAS domain-containing protein [Acidimicrobiales bacterium]|jgi:PAS domain S-box-containing protein|nr:PAS domain-containing protein [Acidimicrobiales bacterium]
MATNNAEDVEWHPGGGDRPAPSRLSALVDNSAALISLKDPFGRYQFVNRAFADLLGVEAERLVGTNDFDHWPDAAPTLRGNDQRVLTAREAAQFEEVVDLADGPRTWLAQKFPVLDPDGVPTAVGSVATDITELTRANATLAARERVLSTVIGASPDVITIAELDGTIRSTSVAFERVFGHPTRAIVDQCLFDIVHPRDVGALRHGFGALVDASDRRSTLRFRVRRPDGRWVTIEAHAQLMLDEHGAHDGVVMVSRDVSDRIALEAELRSAKEEAERASLAKSEFLSRMSHELRTPLNAILGFAQLLEVEGLDAPLTGHVDQILRAGDHLLRLINEVLDVGRVESPHLSLHPELVDAVEVLAGAVGLVGPLADRARVDLVGPPPHPGGVVVHADRQRLTQVLLNLVSNAIKYNHPGGRVEVGVDAAPPDEGPFTRIWVTDTGPGLSPDQVARLFVPFDRLGLEHAGIEGTGVGLSLSRSLAERMGGALGVRSTPGGGSTFWIDLPTTGAGVTAPDRQEVTA